MNPFFSACPICGSTTRTTLIEFPELRFSKCAPCGLVYKSAEDPGLSARLSKRYDAGYFANGHAQYLKRWAHRVAKCRRQLLMCLEFAPHAQTSLDVGCSAGYVLAAAASLGLRPTGIDYAAYAAGLGRQRGFSTAAASLTELPFRDASFDLVTAKHTLEHVRTPKQGLAEIARVLRPGGVALIVVPDVDYRRRGDYFHPERLGWQHHVYYDLPTLSRGAQEAGLEVLSVDKAMLRRRLAKGMAAPYEWLRFGALKVWTGLAKATHLRRELQLIAGKAPSTPPGMNGPGHALPAPRLSGQ
jgi:SAM-dependent methyltransferase